MKKAKQWADEGKAPEQIVSDLKSMAERDVVYFLVDTLEYLHKGGRIGNASYLIGSVLQMKAILGIDDGKAAAVEKQRTASKALNRLKELVVQQCPPNAESYLTVSHSGVQERAEQLAKDLQEALGLETAIPVYEVPPAIVVHGGPRDH